MSESKSPTDAGGDLSREQLLSALFMNLVLQQANLAQMFLGKVPHPETGKTVVDLEAAQMFIDNLEMLEARTKGNLSKAEEGMLKQSLMSVRLLFVEAADKAPAPAEPAPASPSAGSETPAGSAKANADAAEAKAKADAEADERRKFVKKY